MDLGVHLFGSTCELGHGRSEGVASDRVGAFGRGIRDTQIDRFLACKI